MTNINDGERTWLSLEAVSGLVKYKRAFLVTVAFVTSILITAVLLVDYFSKTSFYLPPFEEVCNLSIMFETEHGDRAVTYHVDGDVQVQRGNWGLAHTYEKGCVIFDSVEDVSNISRVGFAAQYTDLTKALRRCPKRLAKLCIPDVCVLVQSRDERVLLYLDTQRGRFSCEGKICLPKKELVEFVNHSRVFLAGWFLCAHVEDLWHDTRWGEINLTTLSTRHQAEPVNLQQAKEADIIRVDIKTVCERNPEYPGGFWPYYRPVRYDFSLQTSGEAKIDRDHAYIWAITVTEDGSRAIKVLTFENKVYVSHQGKELVLVPDILPVVKSTRTGSDTVTVTVPCEVMWPEWPHQPDWVESAYGKKAFGVARLPGDWRPALTTSSKVEGCIDWVDEWRHGK